ncbi:MAG: hypothetical protein RMN51_06130 [Verrucomicrobiota bacterium]|nr:hypothetical protein [Limisphaera sp.]MDW8381668.1 hypothetical protein [Verrucomicrobiota bacterium]
MSLKVVHVVFVTALSLLWFGTAALLLSRASSDTGFSGDLGLGLACLVAGGIVLLYGWYLFRKLSSKLYS